MSAREETVTRQDAGDEDVPRFTRPTGRQLLQGLGGLVIAAAVLGWGLPHFVGTSWHKVFELMRHVGASTALGLLFLMLAGLWLYTFTLTGSLPGLSHVRALIVNVCGSSVGNLLPFGGAAGVAATYAMCRSWGFTRRDISTSVVVSGVWNVLARVVLPIVGIAALLFGAGDLPRAVAGGAIVGGVLGLALLGLFIAFLVSARAAKLIGRTLDKMLRPLSRRTRRSHDMGIDELVLDLRGRISGVVQTGWRSMSFGLLGFFGVYYVLFWFCLNATGVHVSFAHMFAAYALGRLLTAVGVTPGGVGVTETGTAAVLVGWGADPAGATAGVVLFSFYTHLMEIPLGALGWLAWGLTRKEAPTD